MKVLIVTDTASAALGRNFLFQSAIWGAGQDPIFQR